MLIAVWKLWLSLMLAAMTIHSAMTVRKAKAEGDYYDDEKRKEVGMWVSLYIPGFIVGGVGLLSLVIQTFHTSHVAVITYAFVGPSGFLLIHHFLSDSMTGTFGFAMMITLYSDWILAAIAGNWAGTPSSDNAVLYWLFFFAKRLPLLSI